MIIKIKKNIISSQSPTYFIADIAANHDGSLSRAKKLIRLCALSGANAAKFQHFKAETIVSDLDLKK
jgi:N-acetylneuraminate synthase